MTSKLLYWNSANSEMQQNRDRIGVHVSWTDKKRFLLGLHLIGHNPLIFNSKYRITHNERKQI